MSNFNKKMERGPFSLSVTSKRREKYLYSSNIIHFANNVVVNFSSILGYEKIISGSTSNLNLSITTDPKLN